MSLSPEQIELLLGGLHPSRMQRTQGQVHLEAWDVRRWLLRIFGWGGWSFEVVSSELAHELVVPNGERFRYTVVYRVVGRLTIRGADGLEVARFEDGAAGDATNQPSVGDAHDMALKTAMSQALKRCAVNLGDQFGLSLYNGGKAEPVVLRSAPHVRDNAPAAEAPVDPPVQPEPQPEPEPESDRPVQHSKQADPGPWDTGTAPSPTPAPHQPQRPAVSGDPATPPQMRKMHAIFNQVGITDRAHRLEATRAIVGRDIGSANELTKTEAITLLDTLEMALSQQDPAGYLGQLVKGIENSTVAKAA